MEMNQDTLEKMLGMNLKGMCMPFKTGFETHRTEEHDYPTVSSHGWSQVNGMTCQRKPRSEGSIRQASFRYKATIEEIDFSVERGLDRNLQRLADLTLRLSGTQNMFITGSAGTREKVIWQPVWLQACQKGYKVLYANTSRLMGC